MSAADTAALMLPPPPPRVRTLRAKDAAPVHVVSEETYTAAMDAIITRDYFPDLPKLQQQLEWLAAVESGDQDRIAACRALISASIRASSTFVGAATPASTTSGVGARGAGPAASSATAAAAHAMATPAFIEGGGVGGSRSELIHSSRDDLDNDDDNASVMTSFTTRLAAVERRRRRAAAAGAGGVTPTEAANEQLVQGGEAENARSRRRPAEAEDALDWRRAVLALDADADAAAASGGRGGVAGGLWRPGLSTAHDAEVGAAASAAASAAGGLRLDAWQRLFTSEDNASFGNNAEVAAAAARRRHWWLYAPTTATAWKMMLTDGHSGRAGGGPTALLTDALNIAGVAALEDAATNPLGGDPTGVLKSWVHRPRNNLFFTPDLAVSNSTSRVARPLDNPDLPVRLGDVPVLADASTAAAGAGGALKALGNGSGGPREMRQLALLDDQRVHQRLQQQRTAVSNSSIGGKASSSIVSVAGVDLILPSTVIGASAPLTLGGAQLRSIPRLHSTGGGSTGGGSLSLVPFPSTRGGGGGTSIAAWGGLGGARRRSDGGIAAPREIRREATRLATNHLQRNLLDDAALARERAGLAAAEAAAAASSTPQVGGYGFVSTPALIPGVSMTPIMTWGAVGGLPLVLDPTRTPHPSAVSGVLGQSVGQPPLPTPPPLPSYHPADFSSAGSSATFGHGASASHPFSYQSAASFRAGGTGGGYGSHGSISGGGAGLLPPDISDAAITAWARDALLVGNINSGGSSSSSDAGGGPFHLLGARTREEAGHALVEAAAAKRRRLAAALPPPGSIAAAAASAASAGFHRGGGGSGGSVAGGGGSVLGADATPASAQQTHLSVAQAALVASRGYVGSAATPAAFAAGATPLLHRQHMRAGGGSGGGGGGSHSVGPWAVTSASSVVSSSFAAAAANASVTGPRRSGSVVSSSSTSRTSQQQRRATVAALPPAARALVQRLAAAHEAATAASVLSTAPRAASSTTQLLSGSSSAGAGLQQRQQQPVHPLLVADPALRAGYSGGGSSSSSSRRRGSGSGGGASGSSSVVSRGSRL